ncbi:MAG: ATP-dependent Clp protease proteolytic subunit [Lachnospiraceae bacterium]|nr:ATP-dependent Clp protease proteolytic subunit [Lachnospiraceae bacterium]
MNSRVSMNSGVNMNNDIYMNNDTYMKDETVKYTNEWTPMVEEESCNGIREISLRTRHFTNGKIFITGEITSDTANNFVMQLLYHADKGNPVDIYINSPGGSVNAGLVIYDLIQNLKEKIDINIYCVGMAASMAAVILAGGKKGRRFILPHSKCMIHEPLISGGMGGSASSIKKTAESILETKAITNGILAEHTGKTVEEIDEATAYDNYMNAEESVKFGLCDEIRNLF